MMTDTKKSYKSYPQGEDNQHLSCDANGHAGMIKKGCRDANFPFRSTGRIWRLK